ncbi:hypothetical protein AB0M43_15870 [Longispora sp. NPDC051575]|uniref:hypothetical protein n=1 Tax=Longispora sp. NPDC051575 TaxID=3154943 RepID=UPI0034321EF2
MPISSLTFLGTRLLDHQAGGVYCATDAAGTRPLSTDKGLTDQAAAVFAFAEHNLDEELAVALEGLRNLQDRTGHPGFAELADRWWRHRPDWRIRTLRHQLYAATALLVGADRNDDDYLRTRAADVLNRCLSTVRDGEFPARLTESWRPLDRLVASPMTAVAAVEAMAVAHAVGEDGVDTDRLPEIAARLAQLLVEPHPVADLARCGTLARLALALAQAGRLLGDGSLVTAASRALGDATVRPPRRAVDAGHILRAGHELGRSGIDAWAARNEAVRVLEELTDRRNGGVFWATSRMAINPTVMSDDPLLRRKTAQAQATAARALGAVGVALAGAVAA